MKNLFIFCLISASAIAFAGVSQAALITYTDETTYLNAIATLAPAGYELVQEGFEDDAVWGTIRTYLGSSNAADSISNQGIIWSSNHPGSTGASRITTGTFGPERTGFYGLYSSPHGDPDRNNDADFCDVTPPSTSCLVHDGLIGTGTATSTLYGVGGWVDGTNASKVIMFLDGNQANPISFGAGGTIPKDPLFLIHQFIGLIETTGFNSFEFQETEGKTGDEKFLFFDDFTLAGIFPPQPGILVSPSNIDFGSVTVGTTSDKIVTASNTGNADLSIGTIAFSDPLTVPFERVDALDNCSGQTLPPAANCTMTIRYSPATTGTLNDSYDIPSDDPDTTTVTVNVSGTGTPTPTPNIAVSTASLGFGSVTEGSFTDLTLTVSNSGNADLLIGGIAGIDPLATPFEIVTIQDNCSNQTLLPEANCTVSVRFSPTLTGLFSDSFDIPSDDPDTAIVTIQINGTGTVAPTPNIAVSTMAINFGDVTVGTSSDNMLTVSNNGNADLSVGTIAFTNPLAVPFELVAGLDNCSNQILTTSTSCTVSIRYSPTATGILNDSFDIPSDDPDTPTVTVNVSGSGTPVSIPNIAVSTMSIDFGSVTVGTSTDSILTISNIGDADLSIYDIAFANTLAAPFELAAGFDNCSNQTLTPATNCTVTIRYAPTATGILNDSFDIPSDDPDTSTITVNVSGNATPIPIPNIAVSTTSINFGDVTAGTVTNSSLTINNHGDADLSIYEIALTNPLAAPFELVTGSDNCSNQILTPATSCTVAISYSPTATGILNESFDIPSDDPDTSTITVNVSGNGTPVPTPNITVSATSFDFGSINVGSSADSSLTISNNGDADLSIYDVAFTNPLSAPFELVTGSNGCSNQVLTPSTSCTVTIRYTPTTTGILNDSFDVPSDDPDTVTVTINVSGNGTPIPTPDIAVSSTSLDFGNVTVDTTSSDLITIMNNGTADLSIYDIAFVNILAAPFELVTGSDNCSNQILTPSTNCTITIRYAPTATGILNDSFDIPSDDPDTSTVTVNVRGNATPAPTPNIVVSATSLDFGSIAEGNFAELDITVTNTGNADLSITTIASANPLAAPFELVPGFDNCSNQILTPATNCTVTIRYAPTTTGILNDSFDIPSDDLDTATVTINVSGTGTPAPTPNIAVSTTSISFGSVTEGNFAEQDLTVSNTGDADLSIGNIAESNTLTAPFAIVAGQDNCSNQTLLPATACTVTVSFTPTTSGPFNESFDIPSNDPDTTTITVNTSGIGLPASTNNPPAVPSLVFPADAQANLPTTITFRWEESADPEGDLVIYDLYYCVNSNFQGCLPFEVFALSTQESKYLYAGTGGLWIIGLVLIAAVSNRKRKLLLLLLALLSTMLIITSCGGGGGGGGGGGTATEVSVSIAGLDSNTTYYWKVLARDSQGSVESGMRSFTTQ